MGLRRRFLEWYLEQFRGRVETWHGGQLALYWLTAILVAFFAAAFANMVVTGGRSRLSDVIIGGVMFAGLFCLIGPIPATWVWLSARQQNEGSES